jgi:hypothetical protein
VADLRPATAAALDPVRVPLIGALEVPKPMLARVGEDDEGSFQIFRSAARLFLRVVRIEVFTLRFDDAQNAAELVLQ